MLSRESRNENPEPEEKNKWVKKLQQESWELELLVSGFSIVLLSKLTEWLGIVLENSQHVLNTNTNFSSAIIFFMMFSLLASYALIINLIIHLIFRGFWVGIVGLGSVAPNTEFGKLKYSKFFTEKLKKKVTKLDDLVIVVDKISSLIFTFAFLIIFFLISIGLFFVTLVFFQSIANSIVGFASGTFADVLQSFFSILVVLFILSGIIYMIDFLTLGFFKKFKWLSKVYYPIYYVFGWITLSFLYRTLYYNLISKFSKRKVGLIIIPYILALILTPLLNFNHYIYFPEESNNQHITNNYYSDLREKDKHIEKLDIPSYIIKGNLLPIFISYNPKDNGRIKKLNPDFTSEINEGINSEVKLTMKGGGLMINTKGFEDNTGEYLEKLSSLYRIYLNDSLITSPKFYFHINANKKEKGLFTVLNINELPKGENILELKKVNLKDSILIDEDYAFVPFWKE